jgi:Protein of unknown function (DUF2000)
LRRCRFEKAAFGTRHEVANRPVARAVIRAELNLVGIAMRAGRKVIDKIVDGLKFHGWRVVRQIKRPADARFEGLVQGCERG